MNTVPEPTSVLSVRAVPIFWLFLVFTGGILAGGSLPVLYLPAAAAGLPALLVMGLICRRRGQKRSALLCVGLAVGVAGMILEKWEVSRYSAAVNTLAPLHGVMERGDAVRIEGRTIEIPYHGYEREALQARVRVENVWIGGRPQPLSFTTLLRVYQPAQFTFTWSEGDRIQFLARLTRPRWLRNQGQNQAAIYYWNSNIVCLCACKTPQLVSVVEDHPPGLRHRLRATVDNAVEGAVSESGARKVVRALLLGISMDDATLRSAYVDAGLYHLLVISGLHVTLVIGLVGAVLWLLRLPRTAGLVILFVCLAGYAEFVQPRISILRAVIIITIILVSKGIDRPVHLLNVTALAAWLLLLSQPWYVHDPGFQLTFAAVFALAIVYPVWQHSVIAPLHRAAVTVCTTQVDLAAEPEHVRARTIRFTLERIWFEWFPRRKRRRVRLGYLLGLRLAAAVLAPLLAGVAVLAFTAPILAHIHAPLAPASVILMLPALLILWPILIVVLLAMPATLIWEAAAGWLLQLGGGLAAALNELVQAAPLAPRWLYAWPPAVVGVHLVLLLLLVRYGRGRALTLLALILAGLWCWITPVPQSEGAVGLSMLDVGEGEAILIRGRRGESLLVDTGGWPVFGDEASVAGSRGDLSRRVIIPALLNQGVTILDAVVITHFDFDHCGSLPGLIRSFPIRRVYCSASDWRRQPLLAQELARQLQTAAIPLIPLSMPDRIDLPGVDLDILHPAGITAAAEGNANSLVIHGRSGGCSFLLTGDIDARTEGLLAAANRLQPVDLLKCPHHGSRTSSSETLLQTTRPALALISAGPPWRFSHPSPVVVDRLNRWGVRWWSTYRDGQISVRFRDNRLEVECPVPDTPLDFPPPPLVIPRTSNASPREISFAN
ncbi:MAG: ComEC/Rec2 family competence protein [Acidobacteria bacterium]|nr:ComEC/Rec2 family competence protein [Acidobacteriota bacterium]